jgi:hypothetical protein
VCPVSGSLKKEVQGRRGSKKEKKKRKTKIKDNNNAPHPIQDT